MMTTKKTYGVVALVAALASSAIGVSGALWSDSASAASGAEVAWVSSTFSFAGDYTSTPVSVLNEAPTISLTSAMNDAFQKDGVVAIPMTESGSVYGGYKVRGGVNFYGIPDGVKSSVYSVKDASECTASISGTPDSTGTSTQTSSNYRKIATGNIEGSSVVSGSQSYCLVLESDAEGFSYSNTATVTGTYNGEKITGGGGNQEGDTWSTTVDPETPDITGVQVYPETWAEAVNSSACASS